MAVNSSSTFTRLTTSTGAAGPHGVEWHWMKKDIGTDILNTDYTDIPTDFMQVFFAL